MDESGSIGLCSPHNYWCDTEASGAAIYSYGGWFDGGYALSAMKRYRTVSTAGSRLTMGENRWKASDVWRPPAAPLLLYLAAGQTLGEDAPKPDVAAADEYTVDRSTGTGPRLRDGVRRRIDRSKNAVPDRDCCCRPRRLVDHEGAF